jgi:hypothetical protein
MRSDERREVVHLLYEDSGREVTQNFATMASSMSLASGIFAALLTAIGVGELFAKSNVNKSTAWGGLGSPSSVSLVILALAFPLLVRFFIRGLFAYQNLLRFNAVRNTIWDYLAGRVKWYLVAETYDAYVRNWRSTHTFGSLVWQYLKYGFLWLFIVLASALVWGFVLTAGWPGRVAATFILLVGVGTELVLLFRAKPRYFNYKSADSIQLSANENQHQWEAAPLSHVPSGETISTTDGLNPSSAANTSALWQIGLFRKRTDLA